MHNLRNKNYHTVRAAKSKQAQRLQATTEAELTTQTHKKNIYSQSMFFVAHGPPCSSAPQLLHTLRQQQQRQNGSAPPQKTLLLYTATTDGITTHALPLLLLCTTQQGNQHELNFFYAIPLALREPAQAPHPRIRTALTTTKHDTNKKEESVQRN